MATAAQARPQRAASRRADHRQEDHRRGAWRASWRRLEDRLCRLRHRDDGLLPAALAARRDRRGPAPGPRRLFHADADRVSSRTAPARTASWAAIRSSRRRIIRTRRSRPARARSSSRATSTGGAARGRAARDAGRPRRAFSAAARRADAPDRAHARAPPAAQPRPLHRERRGPAHRPDRRGRFLDVPGRHRPAAARRRGGWCARSRR